jgi:uncharacterized membrane protein YfcA
MPDDSLVLVATLAIFLFAGFIKGIVGLGLPVLAIGLLSLLMPPAQAVALLTVPSIVTNVWQAAAGPHLATLTRRLWTLLLASFLAALAGLATGFLVADKSGYALAAVGAALVLYGLSDSRPCALTRRRAAKFGWRR